MSRKSIKVDKSKTMYYQLITSDNDIAGMVAYCKYKQSKIEFIENYKSQHSRTPSEEELLTFQRSQCMPSVVESHRQQGLVIMEAIQALMFKDYNKKFRKELAEIKKEQKKLKKQRKQCPAYTRKSYWIAVSTSMVGASIMAFISLVVWLSGIIPGILSYLPPSK